MTHTHTHNIVSHFPFLSRNDERYISWISLYQNDCQDISQWLEFKIKTFIIAMLRKSFALLLFFFSFLFLFIACDRMCLLESATYMIRLFLFNSHQLLIFMRPRHHWRDHILKPFHTHFIYCRCIKSYHYSIKSRVLKHVYLRLQHFIWRSDT